LISAKKVSIAEEVLKAKEPFTPDAVRGKKLADAVMPTTTPKMRQN